MQAESILTIIILSAFMTLSFLPTMAALEDRRGNGCCAHTKDRSYQRLVVRSEYRVTYLEFFVCW
jgi:hypothetical protein